MGAFQLSASVQNDGNFAHLDHYDPAHGLVKRIEVFRSSQPLGRFGVTGPGTTVDALCGDDHLSPDSNKIHRSIYSEGQQGGSTVVVLEGREEMNPPGRPDGSWDIRTRDLDAGSATFGQMVRLVVAPDGDDGYDFEYEFRRGETEPKLITSPLSTPVSALVDGLPDLASAPRTFGPSVTETAPLRFSLKQTASREEVDASFGSMRPLASDDATAQFAENIDSYLQFGELGPKSVHPGTNLIGESRDLIADYLVWRKYRSQMISLGRLFVPEMAFAAEQQMGPLRRGENNTRPGVYNLYLLAFKLGISLYQLVLDKVYSDYGGVPMELRPGSRLETGREPVVDATRALQTAADLADLLYVRR